MGIRDGSLRQQLLFAGLILIYALSLGINLADKLERVGDVDVGFIVDDGSISPSREDASRAGLRGGGRPLSINGVAYQIRPTRERPRNPALRTGLGDFNEITLERPTGEISTVTVQVRAWEWRDAVFAEGATLFLGLMFFAVGTVTLLLRPFTQSSWAVMVLCILTAGMLNTLLLPKIGTAHLPTVFFLILVGFINVAPFHAALVFPAPHRFYLRHPRVLWFIYGCGAAQAALYLYAWSGGIHEPYNATRIQGAITLLTGILFFVGRCFQLSFHAHDPLVAQRARILLAGSALGLAPAGAVQVLQQVFHTFPVDSRFVYWTLGIFLFSLARVTVRDEIMNARVAVRRAILYAAAVGVLTAIAWLLSAITPYAVAALLLPLLYLWPRFEARLNRRLYPKRAQFPVILRDLGDQLAAATTIEAALDALARTPVQLCDSENSVAFLLSNRDHPADLVRSGNGHGIDAGGRLADDTLIRMMVTTRQLIQRNQITVQPQFAQITDECLQGFERLHAEVILPIVRAQRVIGGLAIGGRRQGDVYEGPEINALTSATQQAAQAFMRLEATERLRRREMEFADLKRFFPPQIIDQVMARGGAAELRTQRKPVTVLFADLRGFTSFSDSVEPEEVMSTLAQYHETMGRRIVEYEGTLERFAGDGFMVFFNDPVEQPDHAERAARMALAMRADMERLRQGWTSRGYDIHLGIGIHTGYATCGFIGYEGRRDYAVIGNVTNLAARLSDAAAPGDILVTPHVLEALRNGYRTEDAGTLELKGFHQPQSALRLLAEH